MINCLLNGNRLKNNLELNRDPKIQEAIDNLINITSFYITDDIKIRYQIYKKNLTKADIVCQHPDCDNQVSFDYQRYTFKKYCCVKCMSTSPQVRKKTIKTCIDKYGMHVNSTQEKKDNIIKTNNEKYEKDCVFSNSVIIDKIKNTHNEKYGTYYKQIDLNNLEYWDNAKYIKEHFLDDKDQIIMDKIKEFFNCQEITIYKKLKKLNIEFKKRKGDSYAETEIIDFIGDSSTIQGDTKFIDKELDILVPNKFAIEYNGLMFHSQGISKYSMFNNPKENRKRHVIKTNRVENKGLQLFQIWENEWLDPDFKNIWKSVINSKLGNTTRIFARKCIIKDVDSKTATKFEEDNHLQGRGSGSIRYGLYYNNELVSLMHFKKDNKYEFELNRFCSKLNTTIIGGASKLLKHFERQIKPKQLVSYANRRWSTGNLYQTIGFRLSHITDPNYFYFKDGDYSKLWSRVSFQKHKLKDKLETFDELLTETQNMYNNNYRKIYDAGNMVFVKKYDD